MRVEKWGDGLAVRLPDSVVKALELIDGSLVTLRIAGERELEITCDTKRENALTRMKRHRVPLPEGFKFNREELYERGKDEPS